MILQISPLTSGIYRGAFDAVQLRFTNTASMTRFPHRGSARLITTRRRDEPQNVKRRRTRSEPLDRKSRNIQKLIRVWSLALRWSNTTRRALESTRRICTNQCLNRFVQLHGQARKKLQGKERDNSLVASLQCVDPASITRPPAIARTRDPRT